MQKEIFMYELKPGDVFTHEIKLNNRETFLVRQVKEKHIMCTSRNEGGARAK